MADTLMETHVDQDGTWGLRLDALVDEPHVPPLGMVRPHDPANLHTPRVALADFVDEGAAPPPAAVWRAHKGFQFGALLNTDIGDCGEAMAIHGNEIMHLDVGTPAPPYQDADAELAYEDVGGYVPGDPSTDNGTDNAVLVDYWQHKGLPCKADGSRHKILGSADVKLTDRTMGMRAVHEFAVLFRAIALPITAQRQTRWTLTDPTLSGDAAPGSWGGHDIPYYSYDEAQWLAVTWGMLLVAGDAFDQAYALQGFVVITEEMLSRKGVGPSGIRWDKLRTEFTRFSG